jgi:hypothetical protein
MNPEEVNELERLSSLHKTGDLSDEEFAREKAKVVGATGGIPQRVIVESDESYEARLKRNARIDRGRRRAVLLFVGICVFIVVASWLSNKRAPEAEATHVQRQAVHVDFTDAPAIKDPQWSYSTSHDAMRDADTYYAQLNSNDLLYFDFPYGGGSQPSLVIRKSPEYGIDAMLQVTKGQFDPDYYNPNIAVKFDNGKVQRYSVSEAADGSSTVLFIGNATRFINAISRAKSVTIEAPFYKEGRRQIAFSTDGFSKKNWLNR